MGTAKKGFSNQTRSPKLSPLTGFQTLFHFFLQFGANWMLQSLHIDLYISEKFLHIFVLAGPTTGTSSKQRVTYFAGVLLITEANVHIVFPNWS
jgi:hypothetical protein